MTTVRELIDALKHQNPNNPVAIVISDRGSDLTNFAGAYYCVTDEGKSCTQIQANTEDTEVYVREEKLL